MHCCRSWFVSGIGDEFDRLELIRPFVAAIRSEETSGPITGAALSSLYRFLTSGMFAAASAHAAAAVADIADAGTHCRFEATDAGHDELVLMQILQVHLACLAVEHAAYLSDTTVWEMVQTCFRINRQMRPPEYSQLLGDRARHSLFEMVRVVFARVAAAVAGNDDVLDRAHSTNTPHIEQRFGVACMVKVLGNLVAMGRAASQRTTGNVRTVELVLHLILEAIVHGGNDLAQDRSLLCLIQDDVCAFLLQNARSQVTSVVALVVRIAFVIVSNLRAHFKVQIEVLVNTVFLGKSEAPPEVQEIVLESLADLARLPGVYRELFINYDCCLRATNVFSNVVRFLCAAAFPAESASPTGNHVLAARCLFAVLDSFAKAPGADGSLDVESLRATRSRKSILFECVSAFNAKPKAGIAAFEANGLIESGHDANGLARLLFQTPVVDKQVLGEFLGGHKPLSCEVRDAFISLFDFRAKTVVEALRICLEGFRLPVEAQQIDRIVQSFSLHYFDHNSRDFANADVVHILTFALIMLNTVRRFPLASCLLN